jgi:hypothetical protein
MSCPHWEGHEGHQDRRGTCNLPMYTLPRPDREAARRIAIKRARAHLRANSRSFARLMEGHS